MTIFDANLGEDVLEALRGITLADEAEGSSEVDASRSIDAYRPPLPELPLGAGEEEDAEDELLDMWPYLQVGE